MARYQKERKDWVNVFKCCEEGIQLLQETGKLEGMGQQLLALLADAAEGRGEWKRAREYDKHVDDLWLSDGTSTKFMVVGPSNRRKAVEFSAAGKR
jgi:hypothetical protein